MMKEFKMKISQDTINILKNFSQINQGIFFKKGDIVSTISPLLPSEGNVIHTSLCIHKSIASEFMYDGYSPEKTTYTCGDMQLIAYIRNAVNDSLKSIFVPLLLCTHDIEGEVKR
jgi:hypothetical protein